MLRGGATVLCPFDTDKSLYVQYGIECGYNVIYNIRDFLDRDVTYEFDYVITNPPFSIKDDVIERCLEYGKPSMLVLPMDSLGGVKRHSLFKSFKSFPKVHIPTRRVNYVDVNVNKLKNINWGADYLQAVPVTILCHRQSGRFSVVRIFKPYINGKKSFYRVVIKVNK